MLYVSLEIQFDGLGFRLSISYLYFEMKFK